MEQSVAPPPRARWARSPRRIEVVPEAIPTAHRLGLLHRFPRTSPRASPGRPSPNAVPRSTPAVSLGRAWPRSWMLKVASA